MEIFGRDVRVRVSAFEGVVTDATEDVVYVKDKAGFVHRVSDSPEITVASLDPPGSPPKLGDVWLDSANRPWLVINEGGLKFIGQMGNKMFLDALRPKRLFYRDGKIQIP